MGSSKKIASGIAWTTIVNVVNGVYGFISVPILLGYFGKSDYGLIGLAMSVNIYLRLMDLGLHNTNVRFFANWLAKHDFVQVNRLFGTSLSFYGTVGLINAIVLVIASLWSDQIFQLNTAQDNIVKHLFYILAISAFISWFSSCFDQLIRANECVGWTQKMTLLPKLAQILILFLTVTIGFTIEWYYALTTFSMVILLPLMVLKIRKLCPFISFTPSFDWQIFKSILPYSLNIFSFSMFQFSIVNLRPVLLGIQSTPEAIADYKILDGVVKIVLLLGGAFVSVFLPSASKVVAQHNQQAQDRIVYQGTKYISISICFCCFAMISVVPDMISVYVGKEYLYLAFWLDMWLLSTLVAHNQAISSLIFAGSNIRAVTYSTASAAIVGLLLCWYLIPTYHVGGTVIGYCAYCMIQILFYYLYYWPKVLHIRSEEVFAKTFLPFCLVGLILSILCRSIPLPMGYGSLLCKGIMFSVLYAVGVWTFINQTDRNFFVGLIKVRK